MTPSQPGTCTAIRNYETDERCGSIDVVGFTVHVTPRDVAGILDGSHPAPEIYLQPRCDEHLAKHEESDRNLRERGPSQFLIDSGGYIGAATGNLRIIRLPQSDETS